MAQSIQDNQAATAAGNATTLANARDLRNDPGLKLANGFNRFAFGDGNLPDLSGSPSGPGYPILVDSFGTVGYSSPFYRSWVGGSSAYRVNRCSIKIVNDQPTLQAQLSVAARWFSNLDDYQFDTDGKLQLGGTRDGRYSWAYLLRMPRLDQPLVELTVVVYRDRPTVVGNFDAQEYPFPATFNPSTKMISVSYTGTVPPPVRPGSWVLDVTQTNGIPNAYFYRVVNITETTAGTVDMEFAVPFRRFAPTATSVSGTIIVMDGVVDVFEKGTGWTAP
jgi:hypothetical protein